MVFALVGEKVPCPQAKLQLDRTAKLQGDVNLFSFLRDLFWEFFARTTNPKITNKYLTIVCGIHEEILNHYLSNF